MMILICERIFNMNRCDVYLSKGWTLEKALSDTTTKLNKTQAGIFVNVNNDAAVI